MTGIEFRAATSADSLQIEDLLMRNLFPSAGVKEHLNDFVLCRHSAGVLVGVAGMQYYGQVALLHSMVVATAWRKRRIGTCLLQRQLDRAARDDIRQVALLTETAAGYFARFGFRPAS